MNKEKELDFVHLHTRSHFSRGESICSPSDLLAFARGQGQSSLALTDRNILSGHPPFQDEAWVRGVNPILGMEVLIDSRTHLEDPDVYSNIYPLVLLAQDEVGYENLIRLTNTAQVLSQGEIKRVNKETLSLYSKGLIALSGGLEGELSQWFIKNSQDPLPDLLGSYLDIFGKDRFFIELQDRGDPFDVHLNSFLVSLARKFEIKYVATADVRYLERAHHNAFLIHREYTLETPITKAQKTGFKHSWIRSTEEMLNSFQDLPDAISNTLLVTDMCQYNFKLKPEPLKVDTPVEVTSDAYLERLCTATLKNKFQKSIPSDYQQRLEEELNAIHRLGLAWFFIFLRRIFQYPVARDILTSSGGANASLVCYLLGISPLDPVNYGLVFDLWMQESMVPYLEMNMEWRSRKDFVEWIIRLTGRDSVSFLSRHDSNRRLFALTIAGEHLGISRGEINAVIRELDKYTVPTLSGQAFQELDVIQNIASSQRKKYQDWARDTLALGDAHFQATQPDYSTLVLNRKPLQEVLPVYDNIDAPLYMTQWELSTLLSQGFFTISIQGNAALEQVSRCIETITTNPRIQVRPEDISFHDYPTWEMLSYGETRGIYGFDNEVASAYLARYKPESLEDLALIYTCSHTGFESTMNQILTYKNNPGLKRSFHVEIDKILSPTQGVLLYREQLYLILATMADTRGLVFLPIMELLMKNSLSKSSEEFKNWIGLVHNQQIYSDECVEDILDYLISRAPLLRSKVEALDASWIAYLTAWFKTHHYALFMQEVLRYENRLRDHSRDDIIRD